MTLARVIVLPEPVTPSRVWYRLPASSPRVSAAIAWGWSPAGSNGATTWNEAMLKSSVVGFSSVPCAAPGQVGLPLHWRDRHHREPADPHQREILEPGIGLDRGQCYRGVEGTERGDVHHHPFGVVELGVGIGITDDPRHSHDRLLGAGVIEEGLVALLHGAEMTQRDGIGDPVPARTPFPGQIGKGVRAWLGLQQPLLHAITLAALDLEILGTGQRAVHRDLHLVLPFRPAGRLDDVALV